MIKILETKIKEIKETLLITRIRNIIDRYIKIYINKSIRCEETISSSTICDKKGSKNKQKLDNKQQNIIITFSLLYSCSVIFDA